MPRLKPAAITLSETERLELEKVVNRHQSPQQLALRARIILQADAGGGNREIARSLGVSRDMVQLWRKRWLETAQQEGQAVERLKDGQRAGAPAQFKMEQIIQLFAIACESPQVYGYPISHSLSERISFGTGNRRDCLQNIGASSGAIAGGS